MDGNLTASDVALLTGNNRNDGMFGGDGAWWLIVLFLFAFCGWGNNGWGNNGNGGGYDENGEMDIKQINSPYLLNYAIKAIQELSAKVDEQEKRIKELERRLQ